MNRPNKLLTKQKLSSVSQLTNNPHKHITNELFFVQHKRTGNKHLSKCILPPNVFPSPWGENINFLDILLHSNNRRMTQINAHHCLIATSTDNEKLLFIDVKILFDLRGGSGKNFHPSKRKNFSIDDAFLHPFARKSKGSLCGCKNLNSSLPTSRVTCFR